MKPPAPIMQIVSGLIGFPSRSNRVEEGEAIVDSILRDSEERKKERDGDGECEGSDSNGSDEDRMVVIYIRRYFYNININ